MRLVPIVSFVEMATIVLIDSLYFKSQIIFRNQLLVIQECVQYLDTVNKSCKKSTSLLKKKKRKRNAGYSKITKIIICVFEKEIIPI